MSTGIFNTGFKSSPVRGAIISAFLTPLVDGTGQPNAIPTTAPLSDADVEALINHEDESKRIYPIADIVSVSDVTADAAFQTFDDDTKALLREGLGSFTAIKVGVGATFKKDVDGLFCKFKKMGVYLIDRGSGCAGENIVIDKRFVDGLDEARPLPIQPKSYVAKLMKANNAEVTGVMLSWDWLRFFNDRDQGLLAAGSDIEDGVILSAKEGLYTLDAIPPSDATTTGFSIPIFVATDSVSGSPQSNLLEANYVVYNETTAAAVTVDSIVESPVIDGEYIVDFTGDPQTIGDVIHMEYADDGFDDNLLIQRTFTIAS